MEFAVAHRASNIGFAPFPVRAIVKHLNKYEEEFNTGFFKKDTEPQRVDIYQICYANGLLEEKFFYIDSDKGSRIYPRTPRKKRHMNVLMDTEDSFHDVPIPKNLKKFLLQFKEIANTKSFAEFLEGAEGYNKINLFPIKRNILKQLKSGRYRALEDGGRVLNLKKLPPDQRILWEKALSMEDKKS